MMDQMNEKKGNLEVIDPSFGESFPFWSEIQNMIDQNGIKNQE